MKGKILDYSIQNSSGIISGEDGNRYEFSNTEWKSDKAPKVNQKVDFEIDDKIAKGIYLESSGLDFDTDTIKSKLSDAKNSEIAGNLTAITSKGVQNKFGFILSVITILALFFPVIEIPFLGNGALIDGSMGKLLFILLVILAFLFYSGISHKFVKICVSIISIIVLFQFYDLISSLNSAGDMMSAFGSRSANLFGLLRFGTPVLIVLTFILTYTGLKKSYKEV
jgi:hypothetical protein